MTNLVAVVSKFCTSFVSSSSSPVIPSMSSAKRGVCDLTIPNTEGADIVLWSVGRDVL